MGDEVGQGWTRKRGVNAQDQLHQLFVKMQNMLISYNRSLNWTDSLIFKQGMNFGRSRIWIAIGSDSDRVGLGSGCITFPFQKFN